MRWARVALVATLVMGCGNEKDDGLIRSPEDLERYLVADVTETSGGLTVADVDCPDRLPATEGASVECMVELGGADVRYTVRRLVGDRIQAQPTDPLVDIEGNEKAVAENLGSGVTVDCGPSKVAQIPVGGRVPCTVTGTDGLTKKIDLVVEDASGRVKAVDAPG